VINEYLEDVFPQVPLRPLDPAGAAHMRYWNKFIDEHVMNYVSIHGWENYIAPIARAVESEDFERLMARIPLPDQRNKWRAARAGFRTTDLDYARDKIHFAVDKVERQLGETAWLAGDDYTLADINFFSYCGVSIERMFPELEIGKRCPRVVAWIERMRTRPAVKRAIAGEDRTAPGLRTWSGAR